MGRLIATEVRRSIPRILTVFLLSSRAGLFRNPFFMRRIFGFVYESIRLIGYECLVLVTGLLTACIYDNKLVLNLLKL